jgi:hypothetical protein
VAYDIHIILGQSQQAGAITDGTSVPLPPFQSAWGYPNTTNGIDEISDTLGTFNSPSRWHAFATEWNIQTGVESLYINLATGGSTLIKRPLERMASGIIAKRATCMTGSWPHLMPCLG